MKLEICVDSLESAKNAVEGGCDQLEVCSALSLGGLTPSAGKDHLSHTKYHLGLVCCLEREILAKSNVKMMIMVRPRDGNFIYTRVRR